MRSVFKYQPLISAEHIRVLTLAPCEDVNALLQCSIGQQRVDDLINHYECISYTWGSELRDRDLDCDGEVLNITANLASALRRFRSKSRARTFWADAICINQDDLDEKSQQIPLMARIYRSAKRVRVWLGEGEEDDRQALEYLAALAKISGPRTLLGQSEDPIYKPESQLALKRIESCVRGLFRLPWFSRRWIVQELVLNSNVVFYCERSKASWTALHLAFGALPDHIWNDEAGIQTRLTLRQFGDLWKAWCFSSDSAIDCSIFSLLNSFHELQCSEIKDKIYAIASLANDVNVLTRTQTSTATNGVISLVPDYGAKDEEVFRNFALTMIRSGKVMTTFANAGARRVQSEKACLASWIPDFRHPTLWPPVENEPTADFKLIQLFESPDGSLTLRILVYLWQRESSWRELLPGKWGSARSQSMWSPPTIARVFPLFKNSEPQNVVAFIQDLYGQMKGELETEHQTVYSGWSEPRHFRMFPTYFSRMLWELVTSQLAAVEGRQSLRDFSSLLEWETRITAVLRESYRNWELNPRWLKYLANALDKRRIFMSRYREPWRLRPKLCLYGFGPCDLEPDDAIIAPALHNTSSTVLFFRAKEARYQVLGDGQVNRSLRHLPISDNERSSEVEFCLI